MRLVLYHDVCRKGRPLTWCSFPWHRRAGPGCEMISLYFFYSRPNCCFLFTHPTWLWLEQKFIKTCWTYCTVGSKPNWQWITLPKLERIGTYRLLLRTTNGLSVSVCRTAFRDKSTYLFHSLCTLSAKSFRWQSYHCVQRLPLDLHKINHLSGCFMYVAKCSQSGCPRFQPEAGRVIAK